MIVFVLRDDVSAIVKTELGQFEDKPFRDKLSMFQKYLKHESVDIRLHALKYLKGMLEKNREELDQMILGYNGIDAIIVELLDSLTLGCCETDEAVKQAYGECIGELGAIEPSHLPRRYSFCALITAFVMIRISFRYTPEKNTFVFYISEDAFVIEALSELTRALQAEKDTKVYMIFHVIGPLLVNRIEMSQL